VIDTSRPSLARVYNCFLGGKDNYAADREVFRQVDEVAPQMKLLIRASRDWLERVTRFLAGNARVDQFLDIGTRLPIAENTHRAAQRVNPDAHVVYVDDDPVAAAHGRARLEENDRTHLVMADLTEPEKIFGHPEVNRYLDLSRPIALIHCDTMHHVADERRPLDIMRRYVELLPCGSYLALSHFADPQDGGAGTELARFVEDVLARGALGSGFFRTREQIERYFGGTELLEPGLVALDDWWPDGPLRETSWADQLALGGVARKVEPPGGR
jgi:S-adenosyl methyltransferase